MLRKLLKWFIIADEEWFGAVKNSQQWGMITSDTIIGMSPGVCLNAAL